MNFKILLSFLCCSYSFAVFAQKNYAVKGSLVDTASNFKIDNATITVLNFKDSVLQKFAYSNKGTFEVNNLKAGEFLLMVTYPDYADFVERFVLNSDNPVYNFGNIKMIIKARLLKEVIIKSRMASMKIKGDTTEFNAAAYATQKNAKVEDLLKQLNGMRINQSGEIFFQGESVSKILVDGEEFFSDDPTLVSKTIRADMVNKIQVYDQKSEKAKLTGVEDGVKVNTINIVLLEDKRKGVFGKVDAGLGTHDYYEAQSAFSKFSSKQKISLYGNISNTGKIGLSQADRSKFGGSGIFNFGEPAGKIFARDAGAHYDTKWNKDKESINLNYTLGAVTREGTTNNLIQNNLPGNFNISSQDRKFDNYNLNQLFNSSFSAKLDSTSDLRVNISNRNGKSTSENTNIGNTTRGNGILQNSSTVVSNGDYRDEYFYSSANYTKRFKKKGRSLSLNASTNFGNSKSNSYLKSGLKYYDEQGMIDSLSHIDQFKPGLNNNAGFTTGFSYTDVFSKSLSFGAGYSFSSSENHNNQRSFNQVSNNNYNQLDSAFSSDYRLIEQSGTYAANISYNKNKVSANAGTGVANASFKQTDMFSDVILDRKFLNWTPNAFILYRFSKAATLTFRYSGATQQPSSYQLQQLRQNTDPFNITVGNSELRPSFRNSFNYNYRVYQNTLDRGINFRGNFSATTNAIINNRSTDSTGVNVFQYANLKGKTQKDWDIYTEFYGHATKLDFVLFISFTVRGSTYFNYVNKQLNKVIRVEYNPLLELSKNNANFNYGLSIGPNFIVNTSSLQQVNNNTKGFSASANYYTKLPLNFFMGSDFNYKFTGKNQVFDRNFEQFIINSYLGKTFFKNESLKLTIKGNDLLNQNTGYYRYGTTDRFTESRNSTIKRYFMFSATWDFAKFGKSLQKQP